VRVLESKVPWLILTIVVFVTVVLVVFAFGAAVSHALFQLGARLRALGGQAVDRKSLRSK
jgi:hypothetical protein